MKKNKQIKIAVTATAIILLLGGLFGMKSNKDKHKVTSVDVFVTSTLTGPQGIVAKSFGDLIQDITFLPKILGSCGETIKTIDETNDPLLLIWSTAQPQIGNTKKQNCIPKFDQLTPVAITWMSYEVCTRKNFILVPNKTYKFGNNKWQPQASQEKMLNESFANKGIKLQTVTFKGSGPTVAGLVNGDVDMAWVATGSAKTAVEAGTIKCLYTTGKNIWGQEHISALIGSENQFPLGVLGLIVFSKNVPDLSNIIEVLENKLQDRLEGNFLIDTVVKPNNQQVSNFINYAISMKDVY